VRDKHEGREFPPPSLAPAALSSPLRAPSHADPSGMGHAVTFHSSAQGPPGLETPKRRQYSYNKVTVHFTNITDLINNIYPILPRDKMDIHLIRKMDVIMVKLYTE
jgi:hypothetical protein